MANDLTGLGDLVISIGGDLSPFEGVLDQIPALAQQAAADISSSFNAVPAATGEVEQSLSALSTSMTEVDAAANTAGTSLAGIGEAAASATPEVEQMPVALRDTAEATSELTENLKEFATQALELAGIALSIEAIKEAIIGSLEAFGELQTATVAMTAMTGDVEGVAKAMEGIPDLANKIGASIASLESAFTKFTRYGVDLAAIPGILSSIADAAMGAGTNFDTAAAAWERAANTGAISAKTIQNMGISFDALAAAMGMAGSTQAQVSAQFKLITESADGTSAATQRLNLLMQAVPESVQGMAAAADTVNKAFNTLSNTVTEAKETVGAALASIGNGIVLTGLVDAIKVLEVTFLGIIEVVGDVASVVVGMSKILIDAFIAIGAAIVDVFSGNFKQAVVDMQTGGAKIAADWMAMGQQMLTSFTSTSVGITNAWDSIGQHAADGGVQAKTAAQEIADGVTAMNQTLVNAQNAFDKASAAFAAGAGTLSTYETALKNLNKAQEDANSGIATFSTTVLIVSDAYLHLQANVANARETLQAVLADIAAGTASWTQYDSALAQLNKDQQALNDGLENAHTAALVVIDDYQKLGVQVLNAATNLQATFEAFESGKVSLTQYDAALVALNKDQMAFAGGLQDVQTVVNLWDVAFQKLGVTAQNAITNLQAVWAEFQAGMPVTQELIDQLNKTGAALQAAAGGALNEQSATALVTAEHEKLTLALQNAQQELAVLGTKLNEDGSYAGQYAAQVVKVQQAEDALTGAHKSSTAAANTATQAHQTLTTALKAEQGVFDGTSASIQDWMARINAASDAVLTHTNNINSAVEADKDFVAWYAQSKGVLDQFSAATNTAAAGANGVATAMTNVAAAAPGMVSGLQAASSAATSAAASFGNLSASFGNLGLTGGAGNWSISGPSAQIGSTISSPNIGSMGLMGGGQSLGAQEENIVGTPEQRMQQIEQEIQAPQQYNQALQQFSDIVNPAAAQLTTAGTALTTAAQTQQDAAQAAYDAAKAATIAAGTTAAAASSLTAANDSISTSTLAAADAANAAALLGTSVAAGLNTVVTSATQLVQGASALVLQTATAVAQVLPAVNGASTVGQLTTTVGGLASPGQLTTGTGVNGASTGGMPFAAPQFPSGPVTVAINGSYIDSQQTVDRLVNAIVQRLQQKGLRMQP